MAITSTCISPACAVTVEGRHKKCPQCGWPMGSSRNIRIRGWVLLACGLFLVGLMGWITLAMAPMLLNPERAYAEGTFTGTPDEAASFLNLFLLVIGFGALSTVNAVYMIATGRTNRWFMLATLLIAVILYATGYFILHPGK